jgi:hypothetical protein
MEYGKYAVAQAGQLASSPVAIQDSYTASGTISFGRPVMRHVPYEKDCSVYNNFGYAVLNKFLGVAVYNYQILPRPSNPSGGLYVTGDTVTVLTAGRIWTTLKEGLTVIPGDYCYINESALVLADDFTNVPTATHITIGRFLTGGTSDGLDGEQVFLIEIQTGFNIPL